MIHHGARTQARSSTGAIRFLYFLLQWNYGLRANHSCKTFLERVLLAPCRNARPMQIRSIATFPFVRNSAIFWKSRFLRKNMLPHPFYFWVVATNRKKRSNAPRWNIMRAMSQLHESAIEQRLREWQSEQKKNTKNTLHADRWLHYLHNLDSYSPCLWRRQNGFCKAIGSRIMQRGCVATLTTRLESCTKRHLTFERHPPIFPGETCLQIWDNIS